MILAQKQSQHQRTALQGKALFGERLLFTTFPSACPERPGHRSENWDRGGQCYHAMSEGHKQVAARLKSSVTEDFNLRRPGLPTLSSWPRFGPHSVIGSYYCYYGYNYRSLIYSLKMLHLFHFAPFFYWKIKFLWGILLIGWIRCYPCFLQAGYTRKQHQAGLLSGGVL